MGAKSSKGEPCLPYLPYLLTRPVRIMADKWGRDILEQAQGSRLHLKGTISEAVLAACRKKLQNFETTKKGKASRIDWDAFRKWEREAEHRADRKVEGIMVKVSK